MTKIHEINELNFDSEVLEAPMPVLVDFAAAWCGPCKTLAPWLETLAAEREGKLKVAKVDVDSAPSLATRYGVRGAPTLVLFQGGRELRRQVGAGTERSLYALAAL